MARGTNQKLKLYYLVRIMLAKTDEEHGLTMPQIIQELGKYDITAERKSIYLDFDDMTDKLGIEIVKEQRGRETYYHVASREFELAEVKLLIDAIQSSKFITEKKSSALIRKIKKFVSEYQAKQLQRQVFVQGRIKTMNETIYYGVDDIHRAISENRKIRFKYYQWNIKKELVPRHNGDWITDTGSALLRSAAKVLWMHKKDQWLFHRWIPHNCYRRFFSPESEGNTHLPGLPDPAPSGWRHPPDRSEFPVGNGFRNNSSLLRRQPVKEAHMHI